MPLTRDRIVGEALVLLDEEGLDRVTMRRLATRLGVQAPTLYWHLRDKAALITELGNAIMAGCLHDLPSTAGGTWRDWLVDAAVGFRRALLAHRDGARVVAAAQLSPAMATFSERAMAVLVEGAVPLRRARLLVLLVERFTLGLVLEEQSGLTEVAGAAPDPAEVAARYPLLTAAVTDYFATGATLDDLFRESIELILAGVQ